MLHKLRMAALMMAVVGACAAAGAETAAPSSAGAAATSAPAKSVDMPVKRVVLFSSGVGFFEHTLTVDGNVAVPLRFETEQINDVLKSLVAFDRDGGTVRNVTYPANDPVNKTLRSFQVDLSGNPPLADILNQMRGSPVEVSVGDETIAGTILGVESKERAVGKGDAAKVITTWSLNIITPKGIRSVGLDEIRNVNVKDEKIKKEMNQALAALAQARDQTKKVVTVNFQGTGKRRAGVGYLVETPIWKSTYRLMLPDATSKDIAKLQGWAIVENQTDNDWNDIDLSLVGGRPLGFIELLYQPLYNPRPVIKPAIAASVHPQTYDDGMQNGAEGGGEAGNITPPTYNLSDITKGGGTTGAAGGSGGGGALFSDTSEDNGMFREKKSMTDYSQGVASIAQRAKIGEMFHYNVENVSLPRQQSSMIPIIAEAVDFDRVSIYNPAVLATRALRGVRLINKTDKYLLGGPVTVFDTVKEGTSYAGDAKVDDVPPGQSRLLSYAVDQDILASSNTDASDHGILGASVAKGLLVLHMMDRQITDYALDNKGDGDKTVIIEQPIVAGYELKEPAKAQEKTDKEYRFQMPLKGKASLKFRVVAEQTTDQEVAILKLSDTDAAVYLHEAKISDKVKKMLQTVAAKRAAAGDLERQIRAVQADRARILEEQKNIRDNIRVLPAGSKSQQDAIHDLGVQDADLKSATKKMSDLQQQAEKARADLESYISDAVIE